MSYQPRLDQLESEIFQTSSTSYPQVLPYVLICVITLLSLYSFCPRSLREKRNKSIRGDRFIASWLIITVILCLAFYRFRDTIAM
jgi:hypothetical protein